MNTLEIPSPSPALPNIFSRFRKRVAAALAGVLLLALLLFAGGRLWLSRVLHDALPQMEGSLHAPGLHAPVRVERNEHGIPHIIAQSINDLVYAQGFITAQDRLWQMDMLRRHAAGELAEVLGASQIEHDRTQRYLQLRESAERDLPLLQPEERDYLERYAAGVNAEIAIAGAHLPAEFRIMGYTPAPWTPVDSLLVGLVMAEDLSTTYPDKLNREAVAAKLPTDLLADLYPVGSWRDHPPAEGKPDMTAPREMLDVPLDESQAHLRSPQHAGDLLHARAVLATNVSALRCEGCTAGSNSWVVSGAHSASGKPIVANDMHLSLTVPGIWYTASLEAGSFHASGVSLPGAPFIIVGHNAHVAWAFTNSSADVQDLYVEQIEGDRFRSADGSMQPLHHQHEVIHVKHGLDQSFDVLETQHGDALTPIITPMFPHETRSLALRWTVFDPGAETLPFFHVNAAATGNDVVEAFRNFGVPSQNLLYGDDTGHIGYHLLGRIPLRGDTDGRSGISPVPIRSGTYEWSGDIPYDKLPAVVDPAAGVLATANARITPDSYPYAISLDWASPYRNERIWKALGDRTGLTAGSMLTLQDDVFSALDKTVAERTAYAVDHAQSPSKRTRAAADLLRAWDGRITKDSAAANIADAARLALIPMVLEPYLHEGWRLYTPQGRTYAFEEMLEHQPARWLPANYLNWNELLTAALERGLKDGHVSSDLSAWTWGKTHTLELSHPVFGDSSLLRHLAGMPVGTGHVATQGNALTVRVTSGRHGQSERFSTDLADVEHATMTLPMGESEEPASPWFMDQWPTWYDGKALLLPFSSSESTLSTQRETHTLLLQP